MDIVWYTSIFGPQVSSFVLGIIISTRNALKHSNKLSFLHFQTHYPWLRGISQGILIIQEIVTIIFLILYNTQEVGVLGFLHMEKRNL